MKNYTAKLKGTKKNNTSDVVIKIMANNKSQAFNLIYSFFEKGEDPMSYASEHFNVSKYSALKGRYFVPRTSIIID